MTDTDSLLFYCETDNIYDDMKEHEYLFDLSDYPRDHPLQSDTKKRHKKVLGKLKDETNGIPISKFVGLRSKMYSFVCGNSEEKNLKGIFSTTVKKDLTFDNYEGALFNETQKQSSMTVIRSHAHQLFSENITKTGLSAFDDKRYLINAVESYAYGHYKIK